MLYRDDMKARNYLSMSLNVGFFSHFSVFLNQNRRCKHLFHHERLLGLMHAIVKLIKQTNKLMIAFQYISMDSIVFVSCRVFQ